MADIYNTDMDAMYRDFLRNQSGATELFKTSLHNQDFKTAHRIAHTLKSLAALMNEANLSNIARKIEDGLRRDKEPTKLEIQELEYEMNRILTGIARYVEKNPILKAADNADFDKFVATKLFNELAIGLSQKRGDVLDTIDKLQTIPQTDELIMALEDFEFEKALIALKQLRQNLEV
ncbi:MAG: Hpt domain-containing protein [Defluviitaleaceae bacterium]|nr:Hpt domain-containing protein [Defluviitaleaceae bacterium]